MTPDLTRLPALAPPGRAYRLKAADGPPLAADAVEPALAVDRGAMAVEAVICTPLVDHQGDVVEPAGVDLSVHRLNPVVFYDHRAGKAPHILPVGKAEDPAGHYTVRLVDLPGRGPALVAKTYFARNSRFAVELFGLVAEDMLRGTSIGFAPGKAEKGLPPPVEVLERPSARGRGSYHFRRSVLHEYSHTPAPTNPEALTVRVEKANYAATCPDLYRALRPHLLKSGSAVTVPRTVRKAMDETTPDVTADPVPEADPTPDAGATTTPTAQAAYDLAQGVEDLVAQAGAMLDRGEHPKGMAKLRKLLDDLKSYAEDATAIGEMVEADVAGDEKAGPEGESAADDPDPPPAELSKSADGLILTKSGYAPRRWSFAEVEKARADAAATATEFEAQLLAEMTQEIQRNRRIARRARRG